MHTNGYEYICGPFFGLSTICLLSTPAYFGRILGTHQQFRGGDKNQYNIDRGTNWRTPMGSYMFLPEWFRWNLEYWNCEFGINLYIKIEPGSESERHSTKDMVTLL